MALFDFLVMAVIVWGTVKIISRGYGPKKGSPKGACRHWSNAFVTASESYPVASWRTTKHPRAVASFIIQH